MPLPEISDDRLLAMLKSAEASKLFDSLLEACRFHYGFYVTHLVGLSYKDAALMLENKVSSTHLRECCVSNARRVIETTFKVSVNTKQLRLVRALLIERWARLERSKRDALIEKHEL